MQLSQKCDAPAAAQSMRQNRWSQVAHFSLQRQAQTAGEIQVTSQTPLPLEH
jgi:hypothetical protein